MQEEQPQPPRGVLDEASITVEMQGKPVTIRQKGGQFFLEDIPARILAVGQDGVRLVCEAEVDPPTLLISGEQFYHLLYGEQAPDLGRFGRIEAQLELLAQQAPTIVPAITEEALASMLRALPVPIGISRHDNHYVWQLLQGSGSAETFLDAMREALTYLEAARMKEE